MPQVSLFALPTALASRQQRQTRAVRLGDDRGEIQYPDAVQNARPVRAPILLEGRLRFAQGLAIGGQWGGAMLLATESAPAQRRGFYGSFAQVGAPAGVVLANVAFLIVSANVSPDAFMSWGWRIPFLLSVVLIGVSLYIQLHLEETPAFQQLQKASAQRTANAALITRRSPILEALRRYPRQITLAAGAFMAVQVTFYLLITWIVAYGSSPAGLNLPRTTMLLGVMTGSLVAIPSLFISGMLSDRYGRRGIYMLGAALLGRVVRVSIRRDLWRRARADHRDQAARYLRQHRGDLLLHRGSVRNNRARGSAIERNTRHQSRSGTVVAPPRCRWRLSLPVHS